MIIYVDQDYHCFLEDDGTLQAFETDLFDDTPAGMIEGYRYIPKDHIWIREDGEVFAGEIMFPAKDYTTLVTNLALSYLTDDQAETVTMLYESWQSGVTYRVGDRRQYKGLLYRCIQAHTSQADWAPDVTPALWVRTWTEEWPEWVQPTGAHDSYNIGDKVSHNGLHWISNTDANIWEPGVYGWDLV